MTGTHAAASGPGRGAVDEQIGGRTHGGSHVAPGAHSTGRDGDARRSGAAAGLCVAAGVCSSALALDPLFVTSPWWPALAWVSLVVVVVGALMRPRLRAAAPFAQALALLLAITLAFLPSTALLAVIPTPDSWQLARTLLQDAAATIAASPPPAPGTRGVGLAVTLFLGLLVLLADVLAATLRRPLLAALPVLLPSLTTVAVTGAPAPWVSFAGPTLALAALLHDDHATSGRRPRRRRPVLAATLAAGALLLATSATSLPHLDAPRPLGLGRGGGTDAEVGFSPAPDLLTDLRNDDPDPVLAYRTDDPAPPPLRVAVATAYADGRWSPAPARVEPAQHPTLDHPQGLTVPTTRHTTTVTQTRLEAPHLAAPGPLVGGTVTGARWAQDPRTSVVVTDTRPQRYEVTYVVPSREVADPTGERDRPADVVDDELDAAAVTPALRSATREAVRGARSDLERAAAIEDWLRDERRFTYTLDVPDPTGDPVDTFLRSRRGYCVHFATAMVLMAREEGIPARLVTGFLPGTPQGSERVVRADDAHAWPELYLAGYGWTRHEPTPAVRTGGAGATGPRPTPTAAQAEPTVTARPRTTPSRPAGPEPSEAARTPTGGEDEGLASGLVRLLASSAPLLLLGALVAASPALSGARHRRRLAAARTPAARIEEHWRHLDRRLADLGLVPAPGVTVRRRAADLQAHLTAPEARAALDRLVDAVEAGRYRPPDAAPDEEAVRRCAADVETVRRAATADADRRTRWRALLWPSDGLAHFCRHTEGFDNHSY